MDRTLAGQNNRMSPAEPVKSGNCARRSCEFLTSEAYPGHMPADQEEDLMATARQVAERRDPDPEGGDERADLGPEVRRRNRIGTTPHQWLTSQRVLPPQARLGESDLSVDRDHFREIFGGAPVEYRRWFAARPPV